MDAPTDNGDRVRRIIKARCGDVLSDDDLALMTANPDDTLPVEIANQVLTVIEAMQDRLESLAESLRPPPPAKTLVEQIMHSLIDCDIEQKRHILSEVDRWVTMEEGTGEPLQ